jgi:hypothetical protein
MRILVSVTGALGALALAVLVFAGIAEAQQAQPPKAGPATTSGLIPQRMIPQGNPPLPLMGKTVTLPARGIDPASLAADGASGTTLRNWTGSFVYQDITYTYTMLGTDPSRHSATTVISAVLIPLNVVFSDGTALNATTPVYGEARSATDLTVQSPLFQPVAFTPGGTDVGTTQYIDAFQRANFWNFVSTTSPDYHVKFHITKTAPVQTLTVPAYFGYAAFGGPGSPIGYVNSSWWDDELGVLLYRLNISTGTLPIFLNYNIVEEGGVMGYHSSFGNPAQVYLSAGFYDQGILSYGGDIVILSQVMGGTTDDPFINNFVPEWLTPTDLSGNLLEAGEPLPDVGIGPVVLNNYTYHPQDLAFLSWFSCAVPSTSVNAWYTFGNYYTGSGCAVF